MPFSLNPFLIGFLHRLPVLKHGACCLLSDGWAVGHNCLVCVQIPAVLGLTTTAFIWIVSVPLSLKYHGCQLCARLSMAKMAP